MDIAELKHQARALEQQGNLGEALERYRQILSEIDAIGGIRQELPVLIKIGDLYLKTGDVDQAVDSYERAAGEYAAQGAAQPVTSLCTKILRADPQAVGAYLRLARRLLDNGFPDGAREVLIDYAQRGNLDKTREGLERLAGRTDDEVKQVLAKAIESAEERIPKRTARPKAPPPPAEPTEPPPEPGEPRKRLTVPVGALDAEPDPSLLEMRPPEPRPPEVMPELAFPTAEELQAPVAPATPPAAAQPAPTALEPPVVPPPVVPPPPPPKLELETSIAPPMEGMVSTMPPAPPAPPAGAMPPPPPEPSQPRLSVPMMEAVFEPPPPAPVAPGPAEAWPERRERPSRPSHAIPEEPPRVSQAQARASRASMRVAHPAYARRGAPTWVWRLLGLVVVAGVIGVLIWQRVIPIDWLRNLLRQEEEQAAVAPPQPRRPAPVRPDSVMARDTATVVPRRPAPRPAPAPPVEEPPRRLVVPTLPPGVALTRSVMLVSGLQVESVEPIEAEGKTGISIVQVLSTGQRVVLEEFPTDTVGAAGEIGVTGIPPDTVVGHVRMADLEIRIKGVGIPEDRIVQFLQDLVEVRP